MLVFVVLAGTFLVGCGGGGTSARTVTTNAATAPPTTGAVAMVQRQEVPLPSAVQETGAAVTSTGLYVIGGYDTSGRSVASTFVFEGTRWSAGAALPIAVNHPAAAAIGDDVYVAGGFTSGAATNRVFVLRKGAPAWKEVAPMHVARAAAALLAVGHDLYAIGGLAGDVQIAQVERYDPATDRWTVVIQMPHPRNHVAGYVDGSLACVAGGREPATSNAVDCLDTSTTTWKTGTALPTATSGAAAGTIDGVLAVAGGESSGETALVPVVQESRGGSWVTQPMLVPRHGTAYATFKGRFWMCGGATAPGYHASTTCTSLGAG
jgi:non-specific serine/threonine protein kinase